MSRKRHKILLTSCLPKLEFASKGDVHTSMITKDVISTEHYLYFVVELARYVLCKDSHTVDEF